MNRAIVITGAGVVSALGCGKAENLAALKAGRSGIAPVKYLETNLRDYPVGEVKLGNAALQELLGVKEIIPRTSLLGILALREAMEQAGTGEFSFPLVSGTTVGGREPPFPNVRAE